MPEGDTLFRTAESLRKALAGRTVARFETDVETAAEIDRLKPVAGRIVHDVRAIGKNLLIVLRLNSCLEPRLAEPVPTPESWKLDLQRGDLVLHTHLRMTGSWHIYRPNDAWQKPARQARVVIHTDAYIAPCFSAPVVELLGAHEAVRHPMLSSRGPNVIGDEFDADEALSRLRRRGDTPIGVAIMSQRVMAGVGNVYKSEVLYIRRISPFAAVSGLSDDDLKGLIDECHRLLRLNVDRSARRTRFALNSAQRLWVYGRTNEPCYTCGEQIRMRRQGLDGRSTFYCTHCQNVRLETSDVIRA